MFKVSAFAAVFVALFLQASPVSAATYEVGPGKPLSSIAQVPWQSLQPGDTVLIHWRSTAYKEKWVICRQGTQAAPITVRGVPGPSGQLPVIDGSGAITPTTLNYWNGPRGVIKIGGANVPADTMPRYITIEGLEIRSARPPFTFTSHDGSTETYGDNASPIYIEKGEHIVVRNNILRDSGNGFFVASSDTQVSRDILVEGNHIYDNGIDGSIYHHNNYTAAIGIVFQFNRFGPLRTGALGNNLKDRSAGLVVRYNWIEGGNRQLDLVDAEDSSQIEASPDYRETHVYGNVLIEPDAAGNRQIAHYGGDSGVTGQYRKGTLFFYNNTVVSTRTDRTTLLRLSTNEEHADVRNNIFYVTAAGNTLSLVDGAGVLDLSHNWFKPGRVSTFGTLTGTINDDGSSVVGSSPGFFAEGAQDYRLAALSAAIDAGTGLDPAVLPVHGLARQYVKHQSSVLRPNDGIFDIGAFEDGSTSTPADLAITNNSLAAGKVGTAYSASVVVAGGTQPYLWMLDAGTLPPGLSLNSQTGAITGTPTATSVSTFTVAVTDSQAPPDEATRSFTIVINAAVKPPVITTTKLSAARLNRAYTRTLAAKNGVKPYSWSVSAGQLPPGLALNASTGVIAGKPTAIGTWNFTVRVQDAQNPSQTDTQALKLQVKRP